MSAQAPVQELVAEGAPRGGLAALCITQTTAWGVLYYALLAAVRPISEDTGWDAALVTAAFSAGLVVSAAAGIAVGRILDRTGPRHLMAGGSLLGALALVLVSAAPNLPVFTAAWLLAGTAQAAVLYQSAFTVISRWYGPARVRPLTILTLVAGFASTIFAPLTAALCSTFGWRAAFLILAGVLVLVTVPLHARCLNRAWRHVEPGLSPAGDRARVRSIRRSPEFLGLQALMVLLSLGLYTVTLNIIPLLMEKGADHTAAAVGLGLVGAGQVAGRMLFAAIPATTRIIAVSGTATGAILLLALLPGPAPLLIAAGMLAGAVRGCQTLLQATLVADRWGSTSLGLLQGTFAAPLTIITALAPAAGSALAGLLGSYTAMAYAMAAAAGMAAGLTVLGPLRIRQGQRHGR
ncbi:MFS family permease [Arthrobacter oryzae]|jgi:MFS family permease|uniref:MFS transporter n=1 Tax=Arthrobacter TaxID=1663 RepID=UPI001F00E76F|nr:MULTISPECIES: MFS transporter [Arthrobacter]MDP9989442.1 MFS family permease [Arthrobacter oryzae]UKA71342.1 MFS transporter [Arthrobacter sp. FW306-06-A]